MNIPRSEREKKIVGIMSFSVKRKADEQILS